MKRLFLFALVLLFAGASAFTLDLGNGLTLGVNTWAGVGVFTQDDGNPDTDDTNVVLKHSDGTTTGADGFRTQATFGYTGDWGGAKLRLRTMNPNGFPINAVIAYGWANLLDGMIVVSGGQIGADNLWGLGKLSGNVFGPDLDGVTGARIEVKPIDGLSLGVALPVPVSNAKPIADVFGGLRFGAFYKSPVVSVVAAVALVPEVKASPATYGNKTTFYPNSDGSGTSQTVYTETSSATAAQDAYVDVLGGIEVPLAPINIIVDARYNGHKTNGYARVAPLVQFSSGPLGAHARADIGIKNDKDGKPATGGNDFGGGTIELGETTKVAFRVGGEYSVTGAIKPYLRVGSDNVIYLDGNGLYVQPGIVFTLGGGNSIEIFDKINKIAADDKLANAKISNQFQIDFAWSF